MIDNSHNFCIVIFFCFKSKDTESFHGFKAHFLVKFCAASIIEVLNYTDIKSPGQSAAPPYSLGLTTFSMVSVVFLFVHPKQHKCRIFVFRPCRMNKGVMLTAPTKGRSPVVSCGADRTCSQPCSKLVLPSPACCAGQAAAEQAGMAAMGRQGLEGKQRIKTLYPVGKVPSSTACWQALPAQEESYLLCVCSKHRYLGAQGGEEHSSCTVPTVLLCISSPN